MSDDDLRLLVDMLTHDTPTEKEYALKRFDEWIVDEQHKYIESKKSVAA